MIANDNSRYMIIKIEFFFWKGLSLSLDYLANNKLPVMKN